tara:strand:- start:572 stop:913 length:342 start_codon:yes stop_codon:yes gene_type:complete
MANTLAPAAVNHVMEGSAKAWAQITGTGTAHTDDSFNCGSLTDHGTGNYSVALSNNVSNVGNIVGIGMEHVNSGSCAVDIDNSSASSLNLKSFDVGTARDREHLGWSCFGDLA